MRIVKMTAFCLLVSLGSQSQAQERLGTVDFQVSCASAVRSSFNRGVALLHDFWYEEARRQFETIEKSDPSCAMAHWGVAMSLYHQIWNRPDQETIAHGRREMQLAVGAKSARERGYIEALGHFYLPENADYLARVTRYSQAMGELYRRYLDVDTGAFYALSLLAAKAPDDSSIGPETKAAGILEPLFAKYPDNPGVVHYLIHACDTPALAQRGLQAARRYGVIASSGAHAAHMPGHIFARLGLWSEDIAANLDSVADAQAARRAHPHEGLDQFHASDFLLYAYLQSGQEGRAKQLVDENEKTLREAQGMPEMSGMAGMFDFYRSEFPAIYHLEMRDWSKASQLEVDEKGPPEPQMLTLWARIIADGHLRDAGAAQRDTERYQAIVAQLKAGDKAYVVDGTDHKIDQLEISGWSAFAAGDAGKAIESLRGAADLQDRVGQGEVDIPAREMLADALLELKRPADALKEYQAALRLSPNRFNGLFNAGRAAEELGQRDRAAEYYATLLNNTDQGQHSRRAEFRHLREFAATESATASKKGT
ncbi:MAG TPA: tetratricopeptide repeat protein [Steroidobacteraceae bacterium]